ncbi:MAG: phage tail assembly chaperone, partial [Parvularculaceae bacterium]|nr:phage tail assembly chaperone [Parvularculaceae bacterium]
MIPWRDWLCFAVAGLGLSPDAFWRLTLVEWRWLVAPRLNNPPALDRAGLGLLFAQYPAEKP